MPASPLRFATSPWLLVSVCAPLAPLPSDPQHSMRATRWLLCTVCKPPSLFLDRDVISFVMGVPAEVYGERAVPRALLRQAMRGVVPDGIPDRRWKAGFTNNVNESMSSPSAGIVSSLQGASMVLKRGYVDGSSLRLELWLQVVFSEEG